MFKVLPDCEEAVTRMWMRTQHVVLTWPQKVGLKSHLGVCRQCRDYQQTLDWVSNTLDKAPRSPEFGAKYKISPEQKTRLMQAVKVRQASGE